LEAGFAHFRVYTSKDVKDFYDHIKARITETNRKWFLLIDYNGCRIETAAWVSFARRGKALNLAALLGSVRYAAGSETEADIRLRAETQDFRPDIRTTRKEALARSEDVKGLAGA